MYCSWRSSFGLSWRDNSKFGFVSKSYWKSSKIGLDFRIQSIWFLLQLPQLNTNITKIFSRPQRMILSLPTTAILERLLSSGHIEDFSGVTKTLTYLTYIQWTSDFLRQHSCSVKYQSFTFPLSCTTLIPSPLSTLHTHL